MTPRVTVLLAVRNGEPFIGAAVASVLAQTFGDFELLVVDDDSTDATPSTLASFADPRIRVLRNERNLGQVPSLNLGLDEARGEYVARLDADDRCLPTRLARQVEALDRDPAVALVGTWLDVVDEDERLYAKVRGHMRDQAEFAYAILVDRYPFGHPSLMYRRDVVRSLGGYDASLAPSEDKDLYRRLALAGHGARAVEEALVLYRRHERQLSQEQAATQKRHDHQSQERFLTELTGDRALAIPLRLLLACEPSAWEHDSRTLAGALEAGVSRASDRLGLAGADAAKLERLLARRAAAAASVAWKAGVRPQIAASPRVAVIAVARGGGRQLPGYGAALLAAPLLAPAWRLERALGHTLAHAPPLARLHRVARGSRALRWLYARLVGTR